MVSCCPALEEPSLTLHPGNQVSALGKLGALTRLMAHYTQGNDAQAMANSIQAMVALTNLAGLEVTVYGSGVGLQQLVPLTALRQLQWLSGGREADGGCQPWKEVARLSSKASCLRAMHDDYADEGLGYKPELWMNLDTAWHTLIHVC